MTAAIPQVPVPTASALLMADTMDAYRSSNKGYRDRQLLYDSSPTNWNSLYLEDRDIQCLLVSFPIIEDGKHNRKYHTNHTQNI